MRETPQTEAARHSDTGAVEDFRTRTARLRRRRTAAKLVAAVFEVTDLEGVDQMSVDDVRRSAGLSRGAFYNYFDTLPALLTNVSALIGSQINKEDDDLIGSTTDPVRDMAMHLRYFILRAGSDRACALLLQTTMPATGAASDRMAAMVTANFADAMAHGAIDVPSLSSAVDMSLGMLAAMLRRVTIDGIDIDRIEEQTRIVLQALGVPKEQARIHATAPLPALPATRLRDAVMSHLTP